MSEIGVASELAICAAAEMLSAVASLPASESPAVERIEVHSKIYGNWWNHLVS